MQRIAMRLVATSILTLGVTGGACVGTMRHDGAAQDASNARLAALTDQLDAANARVVTLDRASRAAQRDSRSAATVKAAAAAKTIGTLARKADSTAASADAEAAAREAAAKEAAKEAARKRKVSVEPYGPVPKSCNEYSGNRAIGCSELLKAGFELDQMTCLDKLWTRESGWNAHSSNGGSGAYGIPQALPGNKMSSEGDDWRDNPATQIRWGLGYIEGRYDTPCGAWANSEAKGYY